MNAILRYVPSIFTIGNSDKGNGAIGNAGLEQMGDDVMANRKPMGLKRYQ